MQAARKALFIHSSERFSDNAKVLHLETVIRAQRAHRCLRMR